MSRSDFYQEIKDRREELYFKKEFERELADIIAKKREGVYDKLGYDSSYMIEIPPYTVPKQFSVDGDDKFKTKLWDSCLSYCAFYYDHPKLDDRKEYKKGLQSKYDQLFPDFWRAPLSNRRELLGWACEQRNNYMNDHGNGENLVDCSYANLLNKYGPDYEPLKDKVGYIKGLFE